LDLRIGAAAIVAMGATKSPDFDIDANSEFDDLFAPSLHSNDFPDDSQGPAGETQTEGFFRDDSQGGRESKGAANGESQETLGWPGLASMPSGSQGGREDDQTSRVAGFDSDSSDCEIVPHVTEYGGAEIKESAQGFGKLFNGPMHPALAPEPAPTYMAMLAFDAEAPCVRTCSTCQGSSEAI
jgi:hypothetical protein